MMNSEVDAIFDAVAKASHIGHLAHKIQEKRAQIREVAAKRCGNCFHWMKSSCKPEKVHRQFKSCSSLACEDFERSRCSERLEEQFQGELLQLQFKVRNS